MPNGTERLDAALGDRGRIERELGEGGMASVHRAEDVKHERRVALKILRPELAAVIGSERFLTEIETTANLRHPHILALCDSGEADGFLHYVMPYVEGETLRDHLDREQQLGVDEAARRQLTFVTHRYRTAPWVTGQLRGGAEKPKLVLETELARIQDQGASLPTATPLPSPEATRRRPSLRVQESQCPTHPSGLVQRRSPSSFSCRPLPRRRSPPRSPAPTMTERTAWPTSRARWWWERRAAPDGSTTGPDASGTGSRSRAVTASSSWTRRPSTRARPSTTNGWRRH